MARVALTAINLFLTNQARPFPPNQLDAAFTYLKVPEALWPQLRLEIPRRRVASTGSRLGQVRARVLGFSLLPAAD